MIIREVEKPRFKNFFGLAHRRPQENSEMPDEDMGEDILEKMQIVGSGKGALALVLRYLSEKKMITSKLDEIMVADWIGYWVYNQIQPFAFPAKKFSDKTKAIFVHHQYGFPQNMDKILEFANEKKLVVIEDCAHAPWSFYKGKRVGSMGEFSIFSFSKWFFCFALGGVKSKFDDFSGYTDELTANSSFGLTLIKDLAKFFYEWSSFSNSEIGSRQKRYRHFLENTGQLGICDHLEKEGVTPYIIPIRCPENKNKKVVETLRDRGVITGSYHFDINRNMLSPNFVPCVWIPCHSGISDGDFSDLTDSIVKTIKK